MYLKDYYSSAIDYIENTIKSKEDVIVDVAEYMGDIMSDNGIIQLFGVDHDVALGMELGFRAGGLIQYHRMDLEDLVLRDVVSKELSMSTDFYSTENLAQLLFDQYLIDESDGFVFYASSSVEDVVLSLAKLAKDKGHSVIVLTNVDTVLANSPENAKALLELSDKVIDFEVNNPDLFFEVDGIKVTQISNLVATMIAQSLTMEIYKYLKEKQETPGVLWSMNTKGADEHNFKLTDKFDGRWNA